MAYKDPADKAAWQKRWQTKRRAEFFNGKVCAECGGDEQLELDHIDPTAKMTHRVWSMSDARREAEIAKCQVLCYDCHKRKSREQLPITRGFKAFRHGTAAMYKEHGCRCGKCKLWRRNKYRERERAA